MRYRTILFLTILFPVLLLGQQPNWLEDFNDNILSGWSVDEEHLRTYNLSEDDGMLEIAYTRTSESWEWDNFNYTPPVQIFMANDPYITVQVKSDISTQLTLKPIYSNGGEDWLQKNVPGDNAWHEMRFDLTVQQSATIDIIYMYLDAGSTQSKSGTILFDDLYIVGDADPALEIINIEAETVDSTTIALSWKANYPSMVQTYHVYRDDESGFTPGPVTLIASTADTAYTDEGLAVGRTYFYRVTGVDTDGLESDPSFEVNAYTSRPGEQPSISILGTNSESIGLYEKYEALLGLVGISYQNPYDPDEVDVRAVFTSPTDQIWEIFGFYDNVENRNQWKVRFSPNETGTWQVLFYVSALNGEASSATYTFEAVESDYHGWVQVSEDNPHYMVHDDGTPFYGVTVAYPWGVNNGSSGLGGLEAYGANMFYYWNGTYDQGYNLIESMDSGLGRYDQPKCGRVDQIVEWAEDRNLKIMLSLWPHDFVDGSVWQAKYYISNPYSEIVEAVDFFGSEEAWVYQEKQYRYIIARWGYSRSMAIWESCCEINGTDGWAYGDQTDALAWVGKVNDFFKANDPMNRPTTVSQGGGIYWPDGYALVDLPNVHMYETGWQQHYKSDPMRSSCWLYTDITRDFRDEFEKPAIFGEAGALDNYGDYAAGSDGYITMYHNALWTTWANGISATPQWWDYGSKAIFTSDFLEQMQAFSLSIQEMNIPYPYLDLKHASVTATGCDAYAMEADTTAFGWARDVEGEEAAGQWFTLDGLTDGAYHIQWIDPWTSETVKTDARMSLNGVLADQIPPGAQDITDIAFKVQPSETGGQPAKLELAAFPQALFSEPSYTSGLTCWFIDSENRICADTETSVTFTLEGPGTLEGDNPVSPDQGSAVITYEAGWSAGTARIIASAPGLTPDTVEVTIERFLYIDDFEDYTSDENLASVWEKRTGTDSEVSLETEMIGGGQKAMRLNYKIGNGSLTYAGIERDIEGDWTLANALTFWMLPDGSGRLLNIRVYEGSSKYWYYDLTLDKTDSSTIVIPFDELKSNSGASSMDRSQLSRISLNLYQGSGEPGSGSLVFDSMKFLSTGQSDVEPDKAGSVPVAFRLYPNYPNPFNHETMIRYALPERANVKLCVYNVQGQMVDVLVNGVRRAGVHEVNWDAGDLSSGLYFYRIETQGTSLVQKCILVR